MTDSLPTTREAWELTEPNLQPRFLAYCDSSRCAPADAVMYDYTLWIEIHLRYFKQERGIRGEMTEAEQTAFTAWLWSR